MADVGKLDSNIQQTVDYIKAKLLPEPKNKLNDLSNLPPEVFGDVLRFLDIPTLCYLEETSKEIRALILGPADSANNSNRGGIWKDVVENFECHFEGNYDSIFEDPDRADNYAERHSRPIEDEVKMRFQEEIDEMVFEEEVSEKKEVSSDDFEAVLAGDKSDPPPAKKPRTELYEQDNLDQNNNHDNVSSSSSSSPAAPNAARSASPHSDGRKSKKSTTTTGEEKQNEERNIKNGRRGSDQTRRKNGAQEWKSLAKRMWETVVIDLEDWDSESDVFEDTYDDYLDDINNEHDDFAGYDDFDGYDFDDYDDGYDSDPCIVCGKAIGYGDSYGPECSDCFMEH